MKSALTTLLSGFLAAAALAAPFAAPAEAIPPFRRAALPIDADSMSSLSSQLTILSQGAPPESAPLRRASAQSLALAIALDPSNESARSTLAEIAGGNSPTAPDEKQLSHAKASVWRTLTWLASPEAGANGNLLANHIGDAASVLDPDHPTAVSLRKSPERGKWDGWVAPLASFLEGKPEVIPEHAGAIPAEPGKEEEEAKEPSPSPPSIKASSAAIGAVLYIHDKALKKYVLRPTAVRMEAREYDVTDQVKTGLRIDILCPLGWEGMVHKDVTQPILGTLGKMHGNRLPDGVVSILAGSSGRYSASRNGPDLSGPGLILANAAVTGIAPGATIIARLDDKGGLALPDYFWPKLGALADGEGGRLIVPNAAEEYLTAMLVLENPEFLLKYEVLAASSPAQAIALCAERADESNAAVFAKFKEVKDKSGTTALRSYLANQFVRQRLAEITEAAPHHLSAKLLAVQGAGERPRVLSRKIIAAAVFQAINGINRYSELNVYEIGEGDAEPMEKSYETARDKLDGLERYAGIRDRDLVTRGKGVAAALRALFRVIGGRGAMLNKYQQIATLHATLVAENRELRAELSKLTGDPLPKGEAQP